MTAEDRARPPLAFGISITPYAEQYREIVQQVLAAERSGLELVGIQDHPYQRRFLDTFALIGDLLARTSRVRMFPDVASLPMRPPAMIAKAASSLDLMSGGRFELGLGAGAFWDAVAGMGGVVRQRGDVLPALEEAIDIIRSALDVGPERRVVRGPGPYYPISGYPPGPAPAHRIEIWVGAMKAGALRLIGRKADGWIPGGGISRIAEFPRLSRLIDDAAAEAGRDERSIRRIANVGGERDGRELIDLLAHLAGELHFDSFIFWPSDRGAAEIERFATEVVPAVREAVA
jgi:alkanesulfonate monooxygenase SsuD/methylene tetrahydromethanopterin reductase-like flavin-dependent oxidoreductase (luciferase family)